MNKKYSIKDICYRPIKDSSCIITSPMDFWKMNITTMINDTDIKFTAKCLKKITDTEKPCFDRIGIPLQINAIFGKQGCEGNEICDDCNICRKTSRALAVSFPMTNDFYLNKIAEKWEKDIFMNEINKFNEELKNKKVEFKYSTQCSEFFQFNNLTNIRIDYLAERVITDELDKQTQQNLSVAVLSYIIMFIYISLFMGEISLFKSSRILVALGGILVVLLSFACSISILSFLEIKISLISAEVVPFLVLAIGVDNMFIILSAKDKKYNEDIYDLMGSTLKEVGPSITTAAFGEFLAFAVGYLTKIPALQSFCLAAGFAVLVDYLLQITVFVAIATLDETRMRENRYDILPFLKYESVRRDPNKKKFCSEFLSNQYVDFLLTKPVKFIVMIIYIGLIIISFIGTIKFTPGLDPRVTVTQDSDAYRYFTTQPDYVDQGPPAYLVFYNIDYNNSTNLMIIEDLMDNLAILSSVQAPIISWYKDFKKFMNKNGEWKNDCNPNLNYLQKLPLEIQVQEFMKIKIPSKCCQEYAVCGEQYKDDINFGEDGLIQASRFRFFHIPLTNQTIFVDSIVQTKSVVSEYSKNLTLYKNKVNLFEYNGEKVPISTSFPYALFYVYYDQYLLIRGIFCENFLIALASIFLAVQLIMNIKSALLVRFYF